MSRKSSRFFSYAAVLLAVMLLLPLEHVAGAMCPMEMDKAGDVAADTCCPESGDTESGNETDAAGSDSVSGTGHCDMDASSAHMNCEDCECFFLPFSDSRSSAEYGITVNLVLPGLSIDSTPPLFTISRKVYRILPDPGPSPSRIPIFLANQVFLN